MQIDWSKESKNIGITWCFDHSCAMPCATCSAYLVLNRCWDCGHSTCPLRLTPEQEFELRQRGYFQSCGCAGGMMIFTQYRQ